MSQPTWLSPDRRALLAQMWSAEAKAATAPVRPVPRDAPLPLSSAQHRLWFMDQLRPGSPLHHVAGAVWLDGPIDPSGLRRALAEVVARHEVLRTAIHLDDEGDLSAVPAPFDVEMPIVDVPAGRPAALDAARRIAVAPFDLASGPLLRGALLRVGPDRHLAVLVVHHVVADGPSLEILLRELAACYEAPGSLAPLPLQYVDYAAWQRGRSANGVVRAQLAFWRAHLRGVSALDLPTDRPRPALPTFAGDELERTISPAASSALTAFARRRRATPFMAVLAVCAAVLARLSGQDDVVVGTPFSGRDRLEFAPLVGCFVNLLPIRLDLSGDPAFGTLLDRVRLAVLDAQAHSELPLEALVQELRLGRDASGRVPLVQHVVQYDDDLPPLRVGTVEGRAEPVETGTAKFDLTFFVTGTADGGMTCRVVYSTELYDAATVDRIVTAVASVCRAAGSDQPLSALPLARAERSG